MSAGDRSAPGVRDTGIGTAGSLAAMTVFFLGCGCFTMADILLGSNDRASAVLAIVGVPLFLIGMVVLLVRSRLGPAPGPRH